MKKSEMLRKAKGFLWDGVSEKKGKVTCICWALEKTVGDKHSEPLCNIIGARLGMHPTVTAWLYHECNIPIGQLTPKVVQKHRHTWVNVLIQEFEAKGD